MANSVSEPEIDPIGAPSDAIVLRKPDVPVTLSELAALKSGAKEVIEARVEILATVRKAALRSTSPTDWILFKSPDEQGGQIVGYLQDCGCDRVRDLYGIEIFDISKPDKIETNDVKVFHYIVRGSGRCKLTLQNVEAIEGGRSSTDDFCKDKEGADLELAVRKAARANLDGNIVRELAGMASVPVEELTEAWAGTWKKVEHCRRGRGFGSRTERLGGLSERAPNVEPPVCPHCNTKGAYRPAKGDRKPFYGCPNYEKHKDKKWIIDAEKWAAEQQAKTAATTAPAKAAAPTAATSAPVSASDIPFGGSREPGQEG